MDSQQVLQDESREFRFVMLEHAVRWRYGDHETMAAQCAHMAVVSARPNVEMAIIPRTTQVRMGSLHTFVIYDERLVKVELFSGGVSLRDPKDVAHHVNLFEFFWGHALTGDDAISLLRSISDEFMRELD
jgi:hypothetical protein